jgi:hypothetical protein
MKKFKVNVLRTVTICNQHDIEIEANSLEEANELAVEKCENEEGEIEWDEYHYSSSVYTA